MEDKVHTSPKSLFDIIDPKTFFVFPNDTVLNTLKAEDIMYDERDQVSLYTLGLTKGTFAFYFSADWCGPCSRFTPKWSKTIDELKDHNLIPIFVYRNRDRDHQDQQIEYIRKYGLNGFHVHFESLRSKNVARLQRILSVKTIPRLVIVSSTGRILNQDARYAIEHDRTPSLHFPWKAFPVLKADESNLHLIDTHPCIILFTDHLDLELDDGDERKDDDKGDVDDLDASKDSIDSFTLDIVREFVDEASKEYGMGPTLDKRLIQFFHVSKGDEECEEVRELIGIEQDGKSQLILHDPKSTLGYIKHSQMENMSSLLRIGDIRTFVDAIRKVEKVK